MYKIPRSILSILFEDRPLRKKKCWGKKGEHFDPAVQKSQNSTLEISKALMEGIKHWKYGQKSDQFLPFSASFTMRLEGIQEPFKIKAK